MKFKDPQMQAVYDESERSMQNTIAEFGEKNTFAALSFYRRFFETGMMMLVLIKPDGKIPYPENIIRVLAETMKERKFDLDDPESIRAFASYLGDNITKILDRSYMLTKAQQMPGG